MLIHELQSFRKKSDCSYFTPTISDILLTVIFILYCIFFVVLSTVPNIGVGFTIWQNGTVHEAILRPLGVKTLFGGFQSILDKKCDFLSQGVVENFFIVKKLL